MNVVKKYWDSVYIYILLLIPIFCICAGMFWTVFKFMGHYPHLKWLPVIIFDCSQIIYLFISLYFIYKTKKNSDYIYQNLKYVKCFMTIVLFVQYNFILHLFASEHVWECTFLFFAGIVFSLIQNLPLSICSPIIFLCWQHIFEIPKHFCQPEQVIS